MKIIFLDIDGVMVTPESIKENRISIYPSFAKSAVEALNLLKDKDVSIVISSTWRKYASTEELKEIFSKEGVVIPIVDTTPVYGTKGYTRTDEILSWVYGNNDKIISWVVIDDDDFDMNFEPIKFFHIDGKIGLTKKDVRKIIKALNYQEKYLL